MVVLAPLFRAGYVWGWLLFPREKPEAPLAGVAWEEWGKQHNLMTLNRRFEDVDPGSTIRTLLHGKIKPKD